MSLFAKLVRRPITLAATAAAVVVLAQLSPGAAVAAAPVAAAPAVGGTSYLDAVGEDGPAHLWRLNDTAAGTSVDTAGTADLTVDASATRGAAGPLTTETATATTFTGTGTVPATTGQAVPGPQSFSVEAWFRTTSTTGGKILGFGNSRTGNSTDYDRHLYLTDAGTLTFGVYPGRYRSVSSTQAYNNGQWHHVVAGLDGTGMDLFVDGRLVAQDESTAGAQAFSGYWRIAGDNTGGWPAAPSRFSFAGSLADVAVYSAPLTLARVQAHYRAAGRSADPVSAPTDAYGAAVYGDAPAQYWRLDETAGTAAEDVVTGDTQSATYSAGTVLGEPGSSAAPAGTSVRFPGSSAQSLISNVQVANPTVYSLETWFRTTSKQGGRLIGFGNAHAGTSSNYDRHLYMIDSGQLRYGIYTGQTATIDSPLSYNDGQWHHAVATQGPGGERLYVDGTQVATGTAVTPQSYTGYWRLGADRTWGGASSDAFAGSLDEAAVYPSVLSAAAVRQHWTLGRPAPPNQAPKGSFTSTVSKLKVTFDGSASTDPDGRIVAYAWDFGDGTAGTGVSPKHTYAAAGTYTVVLTVKDDQGGTALARADVELTANAAPVAAFTSECTDLDCTLDAAASTDVDGTIASYAWDLGDGNRASGETATISYAMAGTYDVTLTVTDDDGVTGKVSQQVTVAARNNPPTAVAAADCTDLDCSFDGSESVDLDGRIAAYAWDFGDGQSDSKAKSKHEYAEPGTYTATLTVTDDRAATGSASVVVTAVAPNRPPVARFKAEATDLTVAFDAAGSSDPDGSITGYAWEFGDGASSTAVAPTHVYAEAGDYDVTLTVTDDDGATGTAGKKVTAVEPNRPPVAAFTSAASFLDATFDAAGSTDSDGRIVAYAWEFGDGTRGEEVSPAHTYLTGGAHTVTLVVTDDDGAKDSISATITVIDPIVARDRFDREVASGLGTAEVGGAWNWAGAGTTASVTGGAAQVQVTAGKAALMQLPAVRNLDTEVSDVVWADTMPTGSGSYFGSNVRVTTTGQYRARVKILSNGAVTLQFTRSVNLIDTLLGSPVTMPARYTAGTRLRIRAQAIGASPTTLRATVWVDGTDEPADWMATVTDSTAGYQSAGAVGLWAYVSGGSLTGVHHFDDVVAGMVEPD